MLTRLLLLLAVLAGAFPALVQAAPAPGGPAATNPDTSIRDGVWAQSYVGRAADPAVRFGTLPNGLRYAVRRNATPSGQMALRLFINSGSIDEADDQQGLAHFIEHMAFRGSKGVPDGELNRILERKGLSLGADTNAFTGQESTIYQFDFPQSDTGSIDTGLMLLREIASELTLSQSLIDAERGVVLSEERSRDGPAYRVQKALFGFILQGQRAITRWPIGKTEIIAKAPASALRSYYEAHYRPDNAVVIAVGDFDPSAMEAAITARFGTWQTPAGPHASTDPGVVPARGQQARLYAEPGATPSVQITWTRPFDRTGDTSARQRRDVLRVVAGAVLNQRFSDLSRRADPPFLAAQLSRANVLRSADLTSLVVVPSGEQWQAGIIAVMREQRRALRDGVTAAEIDRVRTQLSTLFTTAVAGAGTMRTPAIAAALARAAAQNGVYTNPVQDKADWDAIAPTLTVADVNAALRDVFTGSGPLLFLSRGQPLPGGEAELTAAFTAATTGDMGAAAATSAQAWPYADWGPAGTITARRDIADLGATVMTFANGSTLTVKPTDFARDEVLVNVQFGNGRIGLPADRSRAFWMLNTAPVFTEGGTAKLPVADWQRLLAGRLAGASLRTGDSSFVLGGRTRPQDIDAQLQLLTAYVADPGFRPEAVTRMKLNVAGALPQIDSNPAAVLQRGLGPTLHGGDMRFGDVPTLSDLLSTESADIRDLLQPALTTGPIDVVIVGDITIDAAIKAVAATFGALPARAPAPPVPDAAAVRFPTPLSAPDEWAHVVFAHKGRADQAIATIAWPTGGFHAIRADARALQVLAAVVRSRLFNQLREGEGLTYTPQVSAVTSSDLPNYGNFLALVELPPAKVATFDTRLTAIVADLAAKPVTADELDRARAPLVEDRLRDLKTNSYWSGALIAAARDPRDYDNIRDRVTAVQAVRPADVRRVAARYLRPDRAFRMLVRPEGVTVAP